MADMKTTDHFLGDRVSVRCRRGLVPAPRPALRPALRAGDDEVSWLGGSIIARDVQAERTRYVVQLDDNRRVVAYDDDVRRFTLAFEIYETLKKMAS